MLAERAAGEFSRSGQEVPGWRHALGDGHGIVEVERMGSRGSVIPFAVSARRAPFHRPTNSGRDRSGARRPAAPAMELSVQRRIAGAFFRSAMG